MRTIEPTTITQGEQIEWTRSISGYPADEWTLDYRFRGDGPGADVAAVADGRSFSATLTAAASLIMAVGTYRWQAWVTEIADANNKIHVASGVVSVERGFVSGETGDIDLRTPARIALDSIDAAMTAFATSDVQEYEVTTPAGGRRVKRSARQDLLNLRKHYATIVSMEQTRERLRNGGKLMQNIGIVVREC